MGFSMQLDGRTDTGHLRTKDMAREPVSFIFGEKTTEDEFYLATLDRKIFREK